MDWRKEFKEIFNENKKVKVKVPTVEEFKLFREKFHNIIENSNNIDIEEMEKVMKEMEKDNNKEIREFLCEP